MTTASHNLSAIELSRLFYGSSIVSPQPTSTRSSLTPTALHVARETKRRLAPLTTAPLTEQEILNQVAYVEQTEGIQLSEIERTAATEYVAEHCDRYGPLTPLINNPAVSDIIVSRFDNVSFQVDRRNFSTDIRFPDAPTYRAFIDTLLSPSGKSCTTSTPVVDVALSPVLRACVTHESFSPTGEGPTLTLRVHRHAAVTLELLAHQGLAPTPFMEFLQSLLQDTSLSLLLSGEVGSGKTTLARALAMALPANEAVVIIEDTYELAVSRPFTRTLITRPHNSESAGEITAAQAIRASMRMAMNRLIVGEIRDAHAADAFVDAATSGHTGITTIHARSARDAILRLQHLLRRAHPMLDASTIAHHVARAVGVVVHLAVDRTNTRRIVEILEVSANGEGALTSQRFASFHFDASPPRWQKECSLSLHNALLPPSPFLKAPRDTQYGLTHPEER